MAARKKTSDAEGPVIVGEKKADKTLDRQGRLGALVAGLRSRHPDRIFTGKDYTMPWAIRRLPFGIVDLDIATNGGAPAGGMTMLVGKPGDGKNFLMNKLIKKQQELYGEDCAVAVIGTELAYDKTQARAAGVKVAMSDREIEALDTRKLMLEKKSLTQAEVDELRTQVGTFLVVPPTTAEEAFDIAVELVKSGEFNIVGLDSFGSVLPEGDDDKDMVDGDARMAGAAGLNTRLMRKLNNAFAPLKGGLPNLTCFVGINQVRDDLKAQAFMKQTKETGGWSLKHGRFLTVEVSRKEYLKHEKTKVRYGKTIGWEITKQKAGGWEGHTGQYDYIMGRSDIDEGELMLRIGQEYDLIEKDGNTYTYGGVKLGIGEANAAATIAKHGLIDEIRDAILQEAGVTMVT